MSASQNSSQPTLLTRISGVLLGLLCLFFLGTFIVSVELAWEARQWSRPWPTGPGPKDTDEKAKRLEEKLSAYAKRADDVHTLMGFILGLSALYGLALGVSSYLGVQHAVKQAEGSADDAEESAKEAKEVKSKADDALKDLNNALKDAREKAINEAREAVNEVRSQYLLIGRVDVAINDMILKLNRLLPLFDDSEAVLARLSLEDRQSIYFYERAVASLELFDLKYTARQASEIFDRLGRFYGLKYVQEKKRPGGTPNLDDLERSRFYLNRALQKDGANTCALNDRAFLAVEGDTPADMNLARQLLTKSLEADHDQQRPYYNLSIIEHGDAKYHEAETHLTRALDLSRWEVEALPKRKVNLYYNRACARCRLASAEPQLRSTHLDGAITDLEQVFQNRVLWSESEMRQTIAQDWQHGGDLGALRDSQTHAETFERLLSALRD
jgi:hypothetical protein